MKNSFFALTSIFALIFGNCSAARADNLGFASAWSDLAMTADVSEQAQSPRDEVASNGSCRRIEVATDEGYGVSSHETRWECASLK